MQDQINSLDRKRAKIVAKLATETRRYARVSLPLAGRYLAQNGWEYPCQVEDISPGGLLLKTEYPPRNGKHIVLMIDGLGRMEGDIVREFNGGFAVTLCITTRKKDRLGDNLTWELNKHRLGQNDERLSKREGRKSQVYVQKENGTKFLARSVDVSITGMAIETSEEVKPGERVVVGRLHGVVTRRLSNGFAIRFDPPSGKAS